MSNPFADLHDPTDKKAKTFDQWKKEGYSVAYGEKATGRNGDGVPTFTEDQVVWVDDDDYDETIDRRPFHDPGPLRQVAEQIAAAPQPKECEAQSYADADGCPTELAVLKRFWREHQPKDARPSPEGVGELRWVMNGRVYGRPTAPDALEYADNNWEDAILGSTSDWRIANLKHLRVVAAPQEPEGVGDVRRELDEWRELGLRVFLGLPTWPNKWSQDVSVIGYTLSKKHRSLTPTPQEQDSREGHEPMVDWWLKACDWPVDKGFTWQDMPDEHDPCYVYMPCGGGLTFNHHAKNGVDQARAQFVAAACNAYLSSHHPAAHVEGGGMSGVYLNDWKADGFISMVADFEGIYITADEYAAETCPYANEQYWREKKAALSAALASDRWQGVEVLLASYGTEDYGGDAFVLFRRDGKLYEVNGSHCSCYGLEGQWEPEGTTIEAICHRLDNGTMGNDSYHGNKYADELRAVLAALSAVTGGGE